MHNADMGRMGIVMAYVLGPALLCALCGGCRDSKAKPSVNQVTFHQDVAPIVWKNCTSCHRKGESGPFELVTYEQVKKHAAQMAKVTASRFMPPWLPEKGFGGFADERRVGGQLHGKKPARGEGGWGRGK